MVPNFALALSFEGIGLLRRVGSSWARIEEVPIDHPDLDVAVVALRDRAERLDPKGSEVALIIPNEQIRYVDLPHIGGDVSARNQAIRAALDGATPYPLNALKWDSTVSGGRLQIAAVADETLEEAESFARDHGFTPVCHMARAQDDQFDGAVFFGKATGWKRAVERPGRAIEIVPASAEALTPSRATSEATAASVAQSPDTMPEIREPSRVIHEEPQVAQDVTGVLASEAATDAPTLDNETAVFGSNAGSDPSLGHTDAAPDFAVSQQTAAPPADVLPEPELGPEPEPEPEPPVAFASTRTPRPETDLPPAARPSLSIPLDATPPRPRFTPLITGDKDGAAAKLKPAPVPSPAQVQGATRTDPGSSGFRAEAAPLPGATRGTGPDVPPAPLPVPPPVPDAQVAPAIVSTPSEPAPATRPLLAERPESGHVPGNIPPVGPAGATGPTPPLGPAVPSEAVREGQPIPSAGSVRPEPRPAPETAERSGSLALLGARFNLGRRKTQKPAVDTPQTPKPEARTKPARSRGPMRLGSRRKTREQDTPEPKTQTKSTLGGGAAQPSLQDTAPRPSGPDPLARLAALRRPAIAGPASMTAPRLSAAVTARAEPAADLVPLTPRPDPIPAALAPVPEPEVEVGTAQALQPTEIPATLAAALTRSQPAPIPDPAPKWKGRSEKVRNEPAKRAAHRATATADESDRMTVFGARRAQKTPPQKPRFLGLTLTALLLLAMVAIGAWSTVFRDNGLSGLFGTPQPETEPAIASATDPASEGELLLIPESTTEPVEQSPAEVASTETLADQGQDTTPPADAGPVAAATESPAPLAVPEGAETLTPEEADATYAATGIWQRAPGAPRTPPADTVDEVYVASIDPTVRETDAVALPTAPNVGGEPILSDPGVPPPAGVTFDIDARGVVRATPEGAVTPDGHRAFAGIPPVVPPLRNPAATQPTTVPAALPVPGDTAAPEAQTDGTDPQAATGAAPANPLGQVRPEARPDDVVEQRERVTLRGVSREELAKLRPVRRPQTAQEQAVEAEPAAPATAQAVGSSLPPLGRPRNMAAIVERTERARPAEPAEPEQTAAASIVAPRAAEPRAAEPKIVAPASPSPATVAASATVRNAINLNRINLIGVYGTPSNRRALVRLASGKYLKVQVGDKLDGGKVAAIGESELRYTKGGRNVTLQMPRG